MYTIKEFEKVASKLLGCKETRTVNDIADHPEDFDINFLADALLEVDIFAHKEETAKAIVDYLDSQSILFVPVKYIPVYEMVNPESIYYSEEGKTIRKLLFEESNKYADLEEKHGLDEDINKYRIQVRPYGKDIDNLYDFLTKTKETLLNMSKEYNDEIELCPYQLDREVEGSIIYKDGKEEFYCLKFYFEDQFERGAYISSCMASQVARNQEEFDKLGFVEN